MKELEFTGERLVPERAGADLVAEHYARYRFSGRFVKGRRVLDLGCGVGYGSVFLTAAGAEQVVGMDISPDAILYARDLFRSDRVEFSVGDGRALPCRDETFDCVVCLELLEHVDDPSAVLDEARRVLTAGGLLLISTPNRPVYSGRARQEPNPFHVHEMDRDELLSLLRPRFPAVVLFGQAISEGVLIQSEGDTHSARREVEPLNDAIEFGPEQEGDFQEPDYFLAVCGAERATVEQQYSVFYLAPVDVLDELRSHIRRLSADLDEKRDWGLKLDRQVHEWEERVLELQADLEEKVRWARSLESEVHRLRQILRASGPERSSEVADEGV